MTLFGTIVLVILVVCLKNSSAVFWGNRKVDCAVSVWSDWSLSGTNLKRTRIIVRYPSNGGRSCPSLTETKPNGPTTRAEPWDKKSVPKKFIDKFMIGEVHAYKFITNSITTTTTRRLQVVRQALSTGTGPRTTYTILPRDLLFIIDMSGSISSSEWTITKLKLADLIGRLCGSIGRGRQNNRIAIITFSSKVVLNFDFKTHWTLASVKHAILNMRQAGGQTCTGDAFVHAHTYMFEPNTGIRPATDSVKDVLVLTDGHSNCGAKLSKEVARLKVKAFVYALAIGNYGTRGRKEIESMVSRPLIDHVFSVANFIEFKKLVDFLMKLPDKCVPFELS